MTQRTHGNGTHLTNQREPGDFYLLADNAYRVRVLTGQLWLLEQDSFAIVRPVVFTISPPM